MSSVFTPDMTAISNSLRWNSEFELPALVQDFIVRQELQSARRQRNEMDIGRICRRTPEELDALNAVTNAIETSRFEHVEHQDLSRLREVEQARSQRVKEELSQVKTWDPDLVSELEALRSRSLALRAEATGVFWWAADGPPQAANTCGNSWFAYDAMARSFYFDYHQSPEQQCPYVNFTSYFYVGYDRMPRDGAGGLLRPRISAPTVWTDMYVFLDGGTISGWPDPSGYARVNVRIKQSLFALYRGNRYPFVPVDGHYLGYGPRGGEYNAINFSGNQYAPLSVITIEQFLDDPQFTLMAEILFGVGIEMSEHAGATVKRASSFQPMPALFEPFQWQLI